MKDQRLEQSIREYMDIPIPEQLDFVVKKALRDGGIKDMKKNNSLKWIGAAAAAAVVFTASINMSPAFANALSDVPVVGSLVKVLTFRQYKVDEGNYMADLKAPAIDGLENKDLESSLNEKYLEENKKLYNKFIADIEELKENGGGYLGVDSGYEVKTDNDRIFSICRYVVETAASSSTELSFDTIDKKKQILISLPSLFKDDSYIDIISENIKMQMGEQMKEDENKSYFVSGVGIEESVDLFEKISKDQNFYINNDNKLVISFDKYEVAPGYMGAVEFVIPTDAISDTLVGNEYIK